MPSFTTACAEAALTTKSVPPQPLQQRLQRLAQSELEPDKIVYIRRQSSCAVTEERTW